MNTPFLTKVCSFLAQSCAGKCMINSKNCNFPSKAGKVHISVITLHFQSASSALIWIAHWIQIKGTRSYTVTQIFQSTVHIFLKLKLWGEITFSEGQTLSHPHGPVLTCRILQEYSRNYFISQLLLKGRIFNGIFLSMQLFFMSLFHL